MFEFEFSELLRGGGGAKAPLAHPPARWSLSNTVYANSPLMSNYLVSFAFYFRGRGKGVTPPQLDLSIFGRKQQNLQLSVSLRAAVGYFSEMFARSLDSSSSETRGQLVGSERSKSWWSKPLSRHQFLLPDLIRPAPTTTPGFPRKWNPWLLFYTAYKEQLKDFGFWIKRSCHCY